MPAKGVEMERKEDICEGSHRFFALDPIGIQESGKVLVILVCTACGEFRTQYFQVAKPGTPISE